MYRLTKEHDLRLKELAYWLQYPHDKLLQKILQYGLLMCEEKRDLCAFSKSTEDKYKLAHDLQLLEGQDQ